MINKKKFDKFQIFHDINSNELKLVEKFLKRVHFKRGKYIIKEKSKGDSLYILIKGKVKVTKRLTLALNTKMSEKHYTSFSEEDYASFGENGLISSGKRSANVIALTDCVMFKLTRSCFKEIEEKNLAVAHKLMKNIAFILSKRLESADEDMMKLATALSIAVS